MEHFLWQLYHLEKDLSRAQAEVQQHQSAIAGAVSAQKAADAAMDVQRKAQAGLQKERLQLDKAVTKRRSELDRKVPMLQPSSSRSAAVKMTPA